MDWNNLSDRSRLPTRECDPQFTSFLALGVASVTLDSRSRLGRPSAGETFMSGKILSDEYLWERAKARFGKRYIVDEKTGCWNWIAGKAKRSDGLEKGIFTMPRANGGTPAPRCSWQFYRGKIPPSMHILHTCDNPLCVNPDHLYERGRAWYQREPERNRRHCNQIRIRTDGEHNPRRKLGWLEVDVIRQSRHIEAPILAARFNVHKSLIYLIWNHKIWDESLRHA
jgi:hypothetical protein